jgi:predicted kinase
MMKGLPASGKSTKSREIVGNGKTAVRLNRDDLRLMIFGKDFRWSGKKEDVVIRAEKSIAELSLGLGFNVVIDDTNLSPKNEDMWRGIAEMCDSVFELIEMPTAVNDCIYQDRMRQGNGRVGRAVIENMALRYNLLPDLDPNRSKITIWDVDGTLMNISHRLGRVDANGKRIHPSALKNEAMLDKINRPIADWFYVMNRSTTTFIVSGRGTDEAILTEDMLICNGVSPVRMFMRNGGDHRADTIVKQEILDKIIARYGKDSIDFIVDDRPSVVAMWRSNGLKVYPVNQESWEGRE